MLGWERPVPDCRAVREQRLSVKYDYTITSSPFGKGKEQTSNQQSFNNQDTL